MSSPELEYFCHAKQTSDIHIKSVLFLILRKCLVETYVMLCYSLFACNFRVYFLAVYIWLKVNRHDLSISSVFVFLHLLDALIVSF
jgi:hypothetical protein